MRCGVEHLNRVLYTDIKLMRSHGLYHEGLSYGLPNLFRGLKEDGNFHYSDMEDFK